jgi:hypothetical protein
VKLIVLRDSQNENGRWWKTIATKINAAEKFAPENHSAWMGRRFHGRPVGFPIERCGPRLTIIGWKVD